MKPLDWKFTDPRMTIEHLGYIPYFLDADDPAPAKEQINKRYKHGGGWRPMSGFKLHSEWALVYGDGGGDPDEPPDPPMYPLALASLRDEVIVFFPGSWVAIFQSDDTFEVARID
jgi:hypothetical protein